MIALVLGAGVAWGPHTDCTAPLLSAKFPMIIGCAFGEYEGLTGGLIGAGGALFAGWLAWSAVRDQIRSERDLSTLRERQMLIAILAEMQQLFDTSNEVWRAIDAALSPDQPVQQRTSRINKANAVITTLPIVSKINYIKDFTNAMAQELAPIKRGQYIRTWQSIDLIYLAERDDIRENVAADDDGCFRLYQIRIHLSHFERYLSAFDAQTAEAFRARTKEVVDHRGVAEQIRSVVDRAERGEPEPRST
jgi:hypothetical protein